MNCASCDNKLDEESEWLSYVIVERPFHEEFAVCLRCYENDKVTTAFPQDVSNIFYQFGLQFMEAKQPLSAIKAFNKALKNKRSADYLVGLANAYALINEPKKELEALENAIKLDATCGIALRNYVICLENKGEFIKAIRFIDTILNKNPNNSFLNMQKTELLNKMKGGMS